MLSGCVAVECNELLLIVYRRKQWIFYEFNTLFRCFLVTFFVFRFVLIRNRSFNVALSLNPLAHLICINIARLFIHIMGKCIPIKDMIMCTDFRHRSRHEHTSQVFQSISIQILNKFSFPAQKTNQFVCEVRARAHMQPTKKINRFFPFQKWHFIALSTHFIYSYNK